MMSIADQVKRIKQELQGQIIVAATKYVEADRIRELVSASINDVGENRVQDLIRKQDQLSDLSLRWHFIGSLQSNKVKLIVNRIDFLHSLDRVSLAQAIQQYRENKPLDCFIEVHIAQESTKSGLPCEETSDFIRNLAEYDKIRVVGLMGMATLTNELDQIGGEFQCLLKLRDDIQARHWQHAPCQFLSMGMSNDYRIALEHGATHLRLGSVLFRNGG